MKSVALWIALFVALGAGPHAIGIWTGRAIGTSMLGGTDFAREAVRVLLPHRSVYVSVVFPILGIVTIWYWLPVLRWMSRQAPRGTAPTVLVRRAMAGPSVMAVLAFLPWALSTALFPLLTRYELGQWSRELVSQQIATPLISGLLATTVSFLLLDAVVRSVIVPAFGDVRPGKIEHVRAAGIGVRLTILLVAVGFAPFFTMLGLIDSASRSVVAGVTHAEALRALQESSSWISAFYVVLGVLLAVLFGYTLVRPLRATTRGLVEVEAGNLDARVPVESADEIGVLGESVNDLAGALREREHILGTFGRIVEPRVRDKLLQADRGAAGERRYVTVLFLDLAGYTSMAEAESPEETVGTLNEFFEIMSAWVHECGGFVDKFVGDAMLVCFGLFDEAKAGLPAAAVQAKSAVEAAAGIRRRLRDLNVSRVAAGRAPLSVGMGIHSGEVVAGIVGAEERHEYTVIGDAVNIAARLQEACRTHAVDVLVSGEVSGALGDSALASTLTDLGEMEVRGRSESLRVFTLAADGT